jgi:hypothetical protein
MDAELWPKKEEELPKKTVPAHPRASWLPMPAKRWQKRPTLPRLLLLANVKWKMPILLVLLLSIVKWWKMPKNPVEEMVLLLANIKWWKMPKNPVEEMVLLLANIKWWMPKILVAKCKWHRK